MSGFDLLVDTNILVYLTGGNRNASEAVRGKRLSISFITEMELRSWPSLTSPELQVIEKLIHQCRIIDLADEIKERAIQIRRESKLKLPDAIVAATAFYLDLPLLSADRQFTKVKGLDLFLITK